MRFAQNTADAMKWKGAGGHPRDEEEEEDEEEASSRQEVTPILMAALSIFILSSNLVYFF